MTQDFCLDERQWAMEYDFLLFAQQESCHSNQFFPNSLLIVHGACEKFRCTDRTIGLAIEEISPQRFSGRIKAKILHRGLCLKSSDGCCGSIYE
jgi:hypothetical protein